MDREAKNKIKYRYCHRCRNWPRHASLRGRGSIEEAAPQYCPCNDIFVSVKFKITLFADHYIFYGHLGNDAARQIGPSLIRQNIQNIISRNLMYQKQQNTYFSDESTLHEAKKKARKSVFLWLFIKKGNRKLTSPVKYHYSSTSPTAGMGNSVRRSYLCVFCYISRCFVLRLFSFALSYRLAFLRAFSR